MENLPLGSQPTPEELHSKNKNSLSEGAIAGLDVTRPSRPVFLYFSRNEKIGNGCLTRQKYHFLLTFAAVYTIILLDLETRPSYN